MNRKKLLSLTAKDFEWDYYRAKGKGGQKKNKTDSACRCRHLPSGALATAEESRSQRANREKAFERIVKTKEFKAWLKIEVAKANGLFIDVEAQVDEAMREENLKIEGLSTGRLEGNVLHKSNIPKSKEK